MSLKTFTGFRGVAMLAEVSGVQFVIIASTIEDLEKLHAFILPEDIDGFDPSKCQKSVMIQASILPEQKTP